MCFLNESCESHHSPRNFVDSSTGRSVFPILTMGGLWARDRGAVKCMTLHLWAANLKPFLVAHSSMAFTACCRCLSMVSRERPRKEIARSSTKSALKMSLAIQEGSSLIFSPKHITARTPPVGQGPMERGGEGQEPTERGGEAGQEPTERGGEGTGADGARRRGTGADGARRGGTGADGARRRGTGADGARRRGGKGADRGEKEV